MKTLENTMTWSDLRFAMLSTWGPYGLNIDTGQVPPYYLYETDSFAAIGGLGVPMKIR